jgi:Putative ATP-dependent DNA helicase recG C-terminal
MRNPQRALAQACVRFLRFECDRNSSEPGSPSLDRTFSGNVTEQLRQAREFLRESGLIKVYTVRLPGGGFEEQPELPTIVVDEAIVNAVVHRDYALEWQIEVCLFRDAVVVKNPGRLLQRGGPVPQTFRLDERSLSYTPRNPILLGWLRRMRDQKGQHFVRALSEGTKTMLREMQQFRLPAPAYNVNETETVLVLNTDPSRFVRTEARATEFTNLFPLIVKGPLSDDWRVRLIATLRDRLAADGWFIDRNFKGRITAHLRGHEHPLPSEVRRIVRLYPAYVMTFRQFYGKVYLIIDYTVEVRNVLTLAELSKRGISLWVPEILATGFRKFWRLPRRGWPTELMPEWRWGRQGQGAWSALTAHRA